MKFDLSVQQQQPGPADASGVTGVFSPEDGRAFVPLLWGGRKETPLEIAARVRATMLALVNNVPASQGMELLWMRLADDGLGYSPAPTSLGGLQDLALEHTERDADQNLSGPTTLQLILFPGSIEVSPVASINVSAGSETTYVGNSCAVGFDQGYPLGSPDAAEELFTELVRIWQPESATLSTHRTVRQIEDLYSSYAGYISWVSSNTFGTPPELDSATATPFGDGTLLRTREWTVGGVRRLHEDLVIAGVPALTEARKVQVVPQFPSR